MGFRLNELKYIVEGIRNDLDHLSTVPVTEGEFVLGGLQDIRDAIGDLENLNMFSTYTKELRISKIYSTLDDSVVVDEEEKDNIEINYNNLYNILLNFSNALEAVLPEENNNSINIKLPPVNDLGELSKVTKELHNAISLIVLNDQINGQEKIQSVENGSIWINIFLGSAAAVTLIGSVVWSAAVIYKKINEGRITSESLRGMKLKHDALEEVLRVVKADVDNAIDAEARHIASEHFQVDDPENVERIKNSISTMADLIAKGAEIRPALMAPEQVTNLFPDPAKLIGLESKIKRIGNE